MIDVWGMKYDEYFGIWEVKAIDYFGVENRYIHGTNVLIAPEGHVSVREWVKNPSVLIKQIYPDIDFDEIISSVVDIVRKTGIITYKKDNKYYTATCGQTVGCIIHDGDLENIPLPQSPSKEWKYYPELFHTAVKKGNGYVIGKRVYIWGELYIAWRPGTYITRVEKEPRFEFAYTNGKPWIIDEEGYHVKKAPERRPESFDYEYAIDTPAFTALRGTDHDLIITDFVEEKIQTDAKNPKDFFWKIFTGNYTIL